MSLICKVQISLNNLSKQRAQTVEKALEPDNVKFPKGLSLYVEKFDNKLVFHFQSKDSMKQLINTVDELLEHAQISLQVIK